MPLTGRPRDAVGGVGATVSGAGHLRADIGDLPKPVQPLRLYTQQFLCDLLLEHELGDHIRTSHVEMVSSLLSKHGHNDPPTAVHLQMYWLLYTGVLAFWAKDQSRKQEDTLALLDQSIKMFVSWYLAG